MSSTEKKQFELYLIRYVPDVVRGEFLNIGAALFHEDGGLTGLRFTRDWRRARCLYPDTHVEVLEALERHLLTDLLRPANFDDFLRVFNKYVTNGLELCVPKAIRAIDAVEELNRIEKLYLEPLQLPAVAKRSGGRNGILQSMTAELQRAGIAKLMKQGVSVSQYTHSNDAFKLDFLYSVAGAAKMLQAVSLARDADYAIHLAYRYPKIVEGLRRDYQSVAMTAVVEDLSDLGENHVAFGFRVLEDCGIRVARLTDMPSIAEAARIELRA